VSSLDSVERIIMLMAALAIISLFVLGRFFPRLPGILITVVLTTLVAWWMGYEDKGGTVVGVIPQGLPSLSFPAINFDLKQIGELIVSAVIIGLMGLVEAISISKTIAAKTRQPWSVNQELVGQGMANIFSGLSQGYVVSGSFSRSAVNYASGAVTGLASIITGLLIAVTLLFLTDLLYHLPQATLGAVIVMAVFSLFSMKPIVRAWKVERHDGIAAIITFVATLLFAPRLEVGILTGIILSLALFLYRTMRPNFIELSRHTDNILRDVAKHNLPTSETVAIYGFDSDLYFANAGYLEGKLLNSLSQKPGLKVVILDLEGVGQVDATGESMLEKMADRLKLNGVELYIARTKAQVYAAFKRSGLVESIGPQHFFYERKDALKHAKKVFADAVDITPLSYSYGKET